MFKHKISNTYPKDKGMGFCVSQDKELGVVCPRLGMVVCVSQYKEWWFVCPKTRNWGLCVPRQGIGVCVSQDQELGCVCPKTRNWGVCVPRLEIGVCVSQDQEMGFVCYESLQRKKSCFSIDRSKENVDLFSAVLTNCFLISTLNYYIYGHKTLKCDVCVPLEAQVYTTQYKDMTSVE